MKLMPMQLGPINTAVANASSTNGNGLSTPVDRIPFFSSDLIWRYPPFNFPLSGGSTNHSSSSGPMSELRAHLPGNIASDPRIWNREDVISFLRWCESEFDLPNFDMELFQMNGKALCLLTKQDLGQRCPGAGDLLYNILQLMIRESYCLPSSPVTPHFPLTPGWCVPHTPTTLPQLCNSVALSPAPSIDSQSGSPRHLDSSSISTSTPTTLHTSTGTSIFHYPTISRDRDHGYAGSNGASSGSNQSDSDQEDSKDHPTSRPPKPEPVPEISITPRTPTLLHDSPGSSSPPQSPHVAFNKTMSFFSNPADSPGSVTEPNTNGRLLWDFLQQLLNDSMQRYTNYIAWKNRESGVFKIVDPPGLAKLWGIQKNHLSMNYDKMSRALRYYYRVNILRKVQGERHCYQFLRNPSELKSIKNISLLRQQMSTSSGNSNPSTPTTPTFPSPFASSPTVKSEPLECDYVDEPTDLSTGNSREAYLRDRENQRRDRDSRESYLDGKYDTTIKLEYKDGVKKEDFGPDNNNTSMHLQLNIKNQNISTPQDLTLTKHDSVHYETANSYA
ncbi:hypothetical protein M8J76_014244 [Diaphorina citri]|nr:hypothetical protein M8J75_004675 [Diaphorina citri]KAI5733649.1 hypothetical protein M8J76_014244 [Diaphorina citri]KAI5738883.1 hypothetical protein M8J77_012256 [Diaphorina citri]